MQVWRELKCNVLFRWFCGNRLNGPIPDDTTWLCRCRALPSWKGGLNCARLGLFIPPRLTAGRSYPAKTDPDGIQAAKKTHHKKRSSILWSRGLFYHGNKLTED
ncbi:MAG: hypothetical protein ACUVRM_04835 [Bacillota bacterium]